MWNSYPILRPTIALLLGMIGANLLLGKVHFSVYVTFVLFAIAAVVAVWLFYRKPSAQRVGKHFGVWAILAFFLFGAVMAHWRFLSVEAHTIDSRLFRTGVVNSAPLEKQKWWTFRLAETDGAEYMVYLAKGDSSCRQPLSIVKGDSIWLLTYFNMPTSPYLKTRWRNNKAWRQLYWRMRTLIKELKRKARPANKGTKKQMENNKVSATTLSSENPDGYDGYSNYLFFHGIPSVIYCSEGAWGYYSQNQQGVHLSQKQVHEDEDIAQAMRDRYASAGFSEEAQAIIDAMTTGNKSEIGQQLRRQFSDAGISHVLALSGFHLTVIVSLIDILLLRGVFSRRWRRVSAIIVIPFIWAFAAIAGFPPSLVRATIMCSVFQIALVIGHGQQLKNAAAIAGFFMIVFNPMIIMDVGFQLSFLSIVGIAVMGAPLCTWLGRKTGRWAIVFDVACISLTCTLFTFPVVAYHFGRIPLYAIVSNLFVSVIATLIMWAAVFWWIFAWCNPVCQLLTTLLNGLTSAMTFVAKTVAAWPLASINYQPDFYEVILLYAAITLGLMFAYYKKRKYLGISALILCVVPVIHVLVC